MMKSPKTPRLLTFTGTRIKVRHIEEVLYARGDKWFLTMSGRFNHKKIEANGLIEAEAAAREIVRDVASKSLDEFIQDQCTDIMCDPRMHSPSYVVCDMEHRHSVGKDVLKRNGLSVYFIDGYNSLPSVRVYHVGGLEWVMSHARESFLFPRYEGM